MVWGDLFLLLMNKILDLMDNTRLFFGLSLWDLTVVFLALFDLTMIISAIFQSRRKDDEA